MAKSVKEKKAKSTVLDKYNTELVEVNIGGAKVQVPNYIAINLKQNQVAIDKDIKLDIKNKLDKLEADDLITDEDLEMQTESDIVETDELDTPDNEENNN